MISRMTALEKFIMLVCRGILEESLEKAVIDTACTSTVCGEHWLEDFSFKLPEKERKISKSTDLPNQYLLGLEIL